MQEQDVNAEALTQAYRADKSVNQVGVVMGVAGTLLCAASVLYFSSIFAVVFAFCVSGFACILLTRFGLTSLAKIMACVAGPTLFAIIHCYLLPAHGSLQPGLFAFQAFFWLVPFTAFHAGEKLKLLVVIALNVVLALSIPFMKSWFFLDSPLIFSPAVNFLLSAVGGIFLLVAVYLIVIENYIADEQSKKLIDVMQEKNKRMALNEEKLNTYISEVEKTHEEDRKRKWASDGIAMVMDIMRSNEAIDVIYDKLVSAVVRHLKANQAGLFVVDENERAVVVLQLKACYAYERKKYLSKEIEPGQGLVGQCYLERDYIYITDLKEDYLNITSGLGGAQPRALLIMPLKVNDVVEGVIEIASFAHFEKYQIEFVERVSASVASMIGNIKISHRTKTLLEQSQQQTEHIRSQEEELRQNLEELMATQEEMQRKEKHLQAQSDVMEFIVDNIPFPVFIKDESGRYTMVNKAEAQIFNRPKAEIIGFDDSKFVHRKDELDRIRDSDRKIIEEKRPVHFPEQVLTLDSGIVKVFKTSKLPFFNKITQSTNILGVSIDLTDAKNIERKLTQEIEELKSKLEAMEMKDRLFSYSLEKG